jgi:hypothetical protein
MVKIGETVVISGNVYRAIVPNENEVQLYDPVLKELKQLNLNLALLIDTFRWDGKYETVDVMLGSNGERECYPFDGHFKFRPKVISINADQPIIVQINEMGNAPIHLHIPDFPFTLEHINPRMDIKCLYVTPAKHGVETHLKILAFG